MSRKFSTPKSFYFAFSGLKIAFKNEPNFIIHAIAAIVALTLGIILKLNRLEFAILFLTISMVLMLELINTVLEALVDIVSPEIQPKAKIAKDVSASVVLVGALGSIIIGCLLFLPKILQ